MIGSVRGSNAMPWRVACAVLGLLGALPLSAADSTENIHAIKSDLVVPKATDDPPAPGRRVRIRLADSPGDKLYYVLYLPTDWQAGRTYPVIVEYPGNGGYRNALGDECTGRMEDCNLGYGISGGRGFIWVCLPLVDPKTHSHALNWWGDPDATAAYCRAAVAHVCERFGGDPAALVLAGFSRGAIACSYIGLRDDQTAKLWRAIVAHSHFDGVRQWNYPESDADSARRRLARWKGRPLFVSHEQSIDDTAAFLASCGIEAERMALPYPNHTDQWVLKDIPQRAKLRQWVNDVVAKDQKRE